ncbi:hypothetical protein [Kribbella steppae]|uniref:hypothetical protein n=1 Tax=Kribbella steppae TaxID=2512223 RepID=UPI00104BC21C|nr:hypothetical protein [Kribbella steppae]
MASSPATSLTLDVDALAAYADQPKAGRGRARRVRAHPKPGHGRARRVRRPARGRARTSLPVHRAG